MKSRFGVYILYKKVYSTQEKILKKVVGDFDRTYSNLPMYLLELIVRDLDTYVAL